MRLKDNDVVAQVTRMMDSLSVGHNDQFNVNLYVMMNVLDEVTLGGTTGMHSFSWLEDYLDPELTKYKEQVDNLKTIWYTVACYHQLKGPTHTFYIGHYNDPALPIDVKFPAYIAPGDGNDSYLGTCSVAAIRYIFLKFNHDQILNMSIEG